MYVIQAPRDLMPFSRRHGHCLHMARLDTQAKHPHMQVKIFTCIKLKKQIRQIYLTENNYKGNLEKNVSFRVEFVCM